MSCRSRASRRRRASRRQAALTSLSSLRVTLRPGVEEVYLAKRFGFVKHVQLHIGPAHAPKTTGRLIDTYNYAIVTYRDTSSAMAARDAREQNRIQTSIRSDVM